ncbi:unnamed protein product [Pedinophyceae sp. YPF-701]|nr:unnamed protein product [Pedinophyceae sp. YPF-701]
MIRATYHSNGCTKATFSDNTSLCLSADASCFAMFGPEDGEVLAQQLSEFCLRAHAPKLAEAFRFRNAAAPLDAQRTCAALEASLPAAEKFSVGTSPGVVFWPETLQEGVERGLVRVTDDGLAWVESVDGAACVLLAPGSARAAVTFPLVLRQCRDTGRYICAWHTRDVPRDRANDPARRDGGRWAHPLALAAAALAGDAAETGALGAAGSSSARPRSQLPACHLAPQSAEGLAVFQPGSWWSSCSVVTYPSDTAVLVEWRPEGAIRYAPGDGGAEPQVEVALHACPPRTWQPLGFPGPGAIALCAAGRGTFLHAHGAGAPAEGADDGATYAAALLPRQAVVPGRTRHVVGVSAAAKLAQAVLLANAAVAEAAEGAPASEGGGCMKKHGSVREVPSDEEVEVAEVQGVGRFVAFRDGRVTVRFADRTILEIDSRGVLARAIAADGARFTVTVKRPLGIAPYVAAAIEFRGWALLSPSERHDSMARQAAVREHISRTERASEVCGLHARGDVPAVCARGDGTGVGLPLPGGVDAGRDAAVAAMLMANARAVEELAAMADSVPCL